MRVLNVVMDNHIGGPQIRVLTVAKELRKYGIETVILSPSGEGTFAEKVKEENFEVYQVMLYGPKFFNNFSSILGNIKWFLTFPFSVYAITRIIILKRVDIVHVNGLLNLQAPIAGFLTKRKVVWHLISSLYPKTLVLLLRPIVNVLADKKVVVAERLGEYYFGSKVSSNWKASSLIYECADTIKFDPSVNSEYNLNKFKKEFNLGSSDLIVGCVGNIHPIKGYEYFIKAANCVRKKIKNVKFLIVGDTSSQTQYFKTLQKLVFSLNLNDHIIFTGKRNDIPQILTILDLFVLSSVAEGTPLVILEAMAMEVAVVSSDVGAIREQVSNGETGIIVPPRNYIAMADAITNLLCDTEVRIQMGKRGRERVKKQFSLDICAKKHAQIYKND